MIFGRSLASTCGPPQLRCPTAKLTGLIAIVGII
jgi:hypothetical protein